MGISLKYGLLNFLVLSTGLFLALKNYEVWTRPINLGPEKEGVKEVRNKPEAPPNMEKENTPASLNSSTPIAIRNIFSPERKEFSSTSGGQSKPTTRPQIILYGVVITPDYQSASVVNPGRSLYKGERETKSIKVGDQMGGYKLAKILSDRITMEATGDSFDVLLYDPKVPKKRGETRIAEAKTAQPSPAATVEEVRKPKPQEGVAVAKEPAQERVTPSPPIQFRGNNLPIHALSRQERSALISQINASKK